MDYLNFLVKKTRALYLMNFKDKMDHLFFFKNKALTIESVNRTNMARAQYWTTIKTL